MSYVSSKAKIGRPKTSSIYSTADFGTKQFQEKREQFGVSHNEPMTCLFIMWSKKHITHDQFVAGCYYEELCHRLRKSTGVLNGPMKSSLARMQDGDVRVIRNKMPTLSLNENCSSILADIRVMMSYVHPNTTGIMERLIVENDIAFMNTIICSQNEYMLIITKCLHLIELQMKRQSELQETMRRMYA